MLVYSYTLLKIEIKFLVQIYLALAALSDCHSNKVQQVTT